MDVYIQGWLQNLFRGIKTIINVYVLQLYTKLWISSWYKHSTN